MTSATARPKVAQSDDPATFAQGASKKLGRPSQAPPQALKQTLSQRPIEQRQKVPMREQEASGSRTDAGPSVSRMASLPQGPKGFASGTLDKAKGTGKMIQKGVKDIAEKAVFNAPTRKVPEPNKVSKVIRDLSDLDGLEVSEGGKIFDKTGQLAIGEVVEGNPEDLVGWTVSGSGQILDEDGDVIGYVDLIQKKGTKTASPESLNKALDLSGIKLKNLKDLPITAQGDIKDDTGQLIGRIVDGNVDLCAGKVPNENGEVLNDKGELIGRVNIVSPEEVSEGVAEKATLVDRGLSDVSILKDRKLNEEGKILNDAGDVIGQITEGQDVEDLAGKHINEKGEVLDDNDNVLGKAEIVPGEATDAALQILREQQGEGKKAVDDISGELPDISTLNGLTCNKLGNIVTEHGVAVGEVVEGDPKKLWKEGFQLDSQGQFWDRQRHIVGKARPIPEEQEPAGLFSGLGDISIVEDGWVQDESGVRVGKLVDGDPKKLVGHAVDDDGDIVDKRGNVIGRAEPWEELEPQLEEIDFSMVESLTPNKMGNVIGPNQVPIARVVEGDVKEVAGRKIDQNGKIWNDKGEVIGQVELIPESELEDMGPFSGLGELLVDDSGFVKDDNGIVVGRIVEGDLKSLRGKAVDDDGEILDKHGNVKGRAERYELPEEEEEEPDLSLLEGMKVNKLGNVVDREGAVFGRIVQGNLKKLTGKSVDVNGKIWNNAGIVIGQAECIPEAERELPEGIFSGLAGLTLNKDGQVVQQDGQVVGRLVEGEQQRLIGRAVDEDGEIIDKVGNVIGRTERWEQEEDQQDSSPMTGHKVNREGEVRDDDGNLIGKLTEGNLANLVGKKVDDNGYILDNNGIKVGECTLIENLPTEPNLSPEEREKKQQEEEDKQLAKKMSSIVQQALDQVGPLCRQITQHIEKAHSTPKDELDEEKLVNDVKPLIEEAANGLQECKGALRALDPDGQIAATAKALSATHEATPEEFQLAESLKELTQTVVETIENGRRLISGMPHAKKKINPLWALLSEPLFQIIAAVGLLLSGVLGLVSKLLEGLGLGGILHGLLGALGIDKLLEGLGLGKMTDLLG